MRIYNDWAVTYERAIRQDGTLLFPARLTPEFLEKAKRTMGSYIFANQYMNEVLPEGSQKFKKHWFRHWSTLPTPVHTFGFIDPAISEADTADYTGIVVVSVDSEMNWYVRYASRQRMSPTELISMAFKIHDKFKCLTIGVEAVAYQTAILHFAEETMRRKKRHIPLVGVRRQTDESKEMRIQSLIPRVEWGTLMFTQGCGDLEAELLQFPRGRHDDIIDALSSIQEIASYPKAERKIIHEPQPNQPGYEKHFIEKLTRRRASEESQEYAE